MTESSREFDVVVYGATGVTGRLVAQYLGDREGLPDLRWAVAGRDKAKLEGVLDDLGLRDVPVVVANAQDPESLEALARSTRVVCTTVGPYAVHGSDLVAACAAEGTDYCDLSGEAHWIKEMIDAHEATARRTGARILHACGFDSIPSDIGTWFAQKTMQERHGVVANRVACRVKALKGIASGGTIASGLAGVKAATRDAATRRAYLDPYSLNPSDARQGPDHRDHLLPGYDKDFRSWTAPFVMALVNARVVRRTNAVLDWPYGKNFQYDELMLTGDGPLGAARAAGISAAVTGGLAGAAVMASIPPLEGLLERFLPSPGEGPSPEQQAAGFWDFRLLAQHPSDRSLDVRVKATGDRDPGYGSTSKMLAEVALALAAGEATVEGGFWTTASALGDPLLERLPAHAGVHFTALDG